MVISLLLFINKYAHDRNNNNNNKQKYPHNPDYIMQHIKQSYHWLMIRKFAIIFFFIYSAKQKKKQKKKRKKMHDQHFFVFI